MVARKESGYLKIDFCAVVARSGTCDVYRVKSCRGARECVSFVHVCM